MGILSNLFSTKNERPKCHECNANSLTINVIDYKTHGSMWGSYDTPSSICLCLDYNVEIEDTCSCRYKSSRYHLKFQVNDYEGDEKHDLDETISSEWYS